MPTIETTGRNRHVYVHQAADLDVAERIFAELPRRGGPASATPPSTLLVDAAIAETALPGLLAALQSTPVKSLYIS